MPGQFLKDCTPWEGLTLEKLVENCLLLVGPSAGAGHECEEERAVERTCEELTVTPISHLPALLGGRR